MPWCAAQHLARQTRARGAQPIKTALFLHSSHRTTQASHTHRQYSHPSSPPTSSLGVRVPKGAEGVDGVRIGAAQRQAPPLHPPVHRRSKNAKVQKATMVRKSMRRSGSRSPRVSVVRAVEPGMVSVAPTSAIIARSSWGVQRVFSDVRRCSCGGRQQLGPRGVLGAMVGVEISQLCMACCPCRFGGLPSNHSRVAFATPERGKS